MMRDVFIVTSCINAVKTAVDIERRFQQTLLTIRSIRFRAPNSIIILSESSPIKIPIEKYEVLKNLVDYFLMLSDNDKVRYYGYKFLKSSGEAYNLYLTFGFIRKLDIPIRRVFKLTGRGILNEHFDISYYENLNLQGKYVFASSLESWKLNHNNWKQKDTRMVNTRCWSFCYSLLYEMEQIMYNLSIECEQKLKLSYDMEHALYDKLVDSNKLIEKEVVGFTCQISSTGLVHHD